MKCITDTYPGAEAREVTFEWETAGEYADDGYLKAFAEINSTKAISETTYLNNTRLIQVLGAFPAAATDPSVSSGATQISTKPLLAWSGAGGASVYDVYLWRDGELKPETPTVSGLNFGQYMPVTRLLPETTYRWLVVSRNNSGTAAGEEWLFTTRELIAGDLDDSGEVDLSDALMALQLISGLDPAQAVNEDNECDSDDRVGIAEAVFILQRLGALR